MPLKGPFPSISPNSQQLRPREASRVSSVSRFDYRGYIPRNQSNPPRPAPFCAPPTRATRIAQSALRCTERTRCRLSLDSPSKKTGSHIDRPTGPGPGSCTSKIARDSANSKQNPAPVRLFWGYSLQTSNSVNPTRTPSRSNHTARPAGPGPPPTTNATPPPFAFIRPPSRIFDRKRTLENQSPPLAPSTQGRPQTKASPEINKVAPDSRLLDFTTLPVNASPLTLKGHSLAHAH